MEENNDHSEVYLHFFLRGISVDPEEVTYLLRIAPSMQHKVGERHGKHDEMIWKTGFWLLDSKEYVRSKDVQEHLNWLLDLFDPVRVQLATITSEPDVHAELKIVSSLFRRNWDIEIDIKTLSRLVILNVPIAISVTYLSLNFAL